MTDGARVVVDAVILVLGGGQEMLPAAMLARKEGRKEG